MKIGYLRPSKSGPSILEQKTALEAAGVKVSNPDAVYEEPEAKPRRQATFDQRLDGRVALRAKDVLVIHSAPRLGATEAEIRAAAVAVSAKGAVIYDCATASEIRFHPDAGKLLAWAQEGAELAAKERLAKSRQAITKRGAPPKALRGTKLTRAKALWADLDRSVKSIAKELDVAPRTLYRHLPKRRA
jgi:hypothetical protein